MCFDMYFLYMFFLLNQQSQIKMANKDEELSLDNEVDQQQMLMVVAANGKSFEIEVKAAYLSKLVETTMESDATADSVPIPFVQEDILKLIVEYLRHHNGVEPPEIQKPVRAKNMKDACDDKWSGEFIDAIGNNRKQLYDLILAANYMDINSLLHLGCAKVASLIKGKPTEEIDDILAVEQAPNKKTKVLTT